MTKVLPISLEVVEVGGEPCFSVEGISSILRFNEGLLELGLFIDAI